MKVGQEFKAVDRLGMVSTWIVESINEDVFCLRATRETLEKCEKDVETYKNYNKFDATKLHTFVTIEVKQEWFDNRKITMLEGE